MILVIGGRKGGTGKSTLATNLAVLQAREGRDVVLIDTDPNSHSARDWAANRAALEIAPAVPCFELTGKAITAQVPGLAAKYQDVIVDVGGRDGEELRRAMAVADAMLLPVQASQFDIFTLADMDELAAAVNQIRLRPLQVSVLITRASPNPLVAERRRAGEVIRDFANFRLLPGVVTERIAYRSAPEEGLGVVEMRRVDPKARTEMMGLAEALWAPAEDGEMSDARATA